mgnify:CR=1 FL=1
MWVSPPIPYRHMQIISQGMGCICILSLALPHGSHCKPAASASSCSLREWRYYFARKVMRWPIELLDSIRSGPLTRSLLPAYGAEVLFTYIYIYIYALITWWVYIVYTLRRVLMCVLSEHYSRLSSRTYIKRKHVTWSCSWTQQRGGR